MRRGPRVWLLVLPIAALRGTAPATVWRAREGRVEAVAVHLGLRTLDAIQTRGLIALCVPVRVPRSVVYGQLMPMLLSLGHPGVLRLLAGLASRSMRE